MRQVVKMGVCLVTLAAIWYATPQAEAQWRGYGVRFGPGGLYVGPTRSWNYGYPYGYGSYGFRGYNYGRNWYGGYYGHWPRSYYSYYPRTYPYYYPSTYVYPSTYYVPPTYYYPSSTTVHESPPPAPDQRAHIRIHVDDPNAEIWMNGVATQQRGTNRLFETPPITGSANSYEIRARWRDENGEMTERTQTISVAPGQETVVDFQ